MLRGSNVLVTGAGGFLGAWLCEALAERGAHVIGLDREYRKESRAQELTSRVELVTLDLEDFDDVVRILNERNIDFICHLAAQAIVGAANRNPISTFKSNIMATWNVLEAARILRSSSYAVKGVIVTSSDKAYGDQKVLPYLEDAPMQGRFPYDVSKSCADLIARSYFHTYGMPVCITRCGNLYGGGDFNFSRIVPGTIMSLLNDENPVIRSDGTPIRDYIYVEDAAEAIAQLAERMYKDVTMHGEAFNISNDQPVSVLAIVDMIRKLMKREDLEPVIEAKATGEILEQYLNSSKIRKWLGWRPSVDLEQGLRRTIEWYRHRHPTAKITDTLTKA